MHVHTLLQEGGHVQLSSSLPGQLAQLRVIGRGQSREAGAKPVEVELKGQSAECRVHIGATHLLSFSPRSGLKPDMPAMLMWSLMIMMSPTLNWGFRLPEALVTTSVLTPSRCRTLIGMVTCRGEGGRSERGVREGG